VRTDSLEPSLLALLAPGARAEIAGLRGEMGEFRGEVRGEIAEFRSQMGEFRGEVRGEIVELRGEMRGNHATVSADIRRIDDKLTWALDLRERIVALETKLAVAPARP